jgi:ArsR family transcriptional regulator
MTVYVSQHPSLPHHIHVCQYRRMSKSLIMLDPVGTAACCPPLSAQPLSQAQADQIAPLLKALADPVRLRLMSLVASHAGGEACVCDLNDAFDLSQPTISHHLSCTTGTAGPRSAESGSTPVSRGARQRGCADLYTCHWRFPSGPRVCLMHLHRFMSINDEC